MSPVLTKCWNWKLTLATNFGSTAQMVTKFGDQILATIFFYQTDYFKGEKISNFIFIWQKKITWGTTYV